MTLRDYQVRAVASVRRHWEAGERSVCLVAPTGAGKTAMGEELVADSEPAVWIAHRRELITQTAQRLASRFGSSSVGMIMPGERENPSARVQVATIQTLIARESKPKASALVLDEAHHYAPAEWREAEAWYPGCRIVGLTATPERKDGEPLGDIFGALVVAASYSELVKQGYLVPARVYRPSTSLGNDLAQDPVDAWAKYSEGSRTFLFCGRVIDAHAWAQRFRDEGVPADVIEAKTPTRERDESLARFKAGQLKVICNVNTLTEGVDVPEARTVMLARKFGHVGGYLQAVGRALRAARGKADAILIDLVGASVRHGLPTDDRTYSLSGRAISGNKSTCGSVGGGAAEWAQEIVGTELRMVASGALTMGAEPAAVSLSRVNDGDRCRELERMRLSLARSGLRPELAQIAYQQRYGERPR